MRTRLVSVLVLSALLAPFVHRIHAANRQDPQPNVLLIVLDDLGAENLSFWPTNAPPVTTAYTPVLEGLAQSGIMYTSCWSQPVCAPTRACLQTGLYAFRTGMGTNPAAADALNPATQTIADVLETGLPSGSAYATALFGKWHLGDLGNLDHPIECGYDSFDGTEQNNFTSLPGADHYNWREIIAGPGGALPPIDHLPGSTLPMPEADYTPKVIGDAARAWIDARNAESKPWFACVNFNVPHTPHQVPPQSMVRPQTWLDGVGAIPGWDAGFDGNGLALADKVRVYDAAIEAVDRQIGILVADLENTTILVVGDNGTGVTVAQAPYRASHAKNSIHSGGTRVPMIVSGAAVPSAHLGSTCSRPISVVDFLPTIAELAGATFAGPIDGVSFVPLIDDPTAPATRPWAFTQIFEPNGAYAPNSPPPTVWLSRLDRGITDGRFHYLRFLSGSTYVEKLYDLSLDPLEAINRMDCYLTGNCGTHAPFTPAEQATIQTLINAMVALSDP